MIENKELYSFPEPETNSENEFDELGEDGLETAPESNFPLKLISHAITAIFCLILILMISKAGSQWSNWTRAKLHSAINASSQDTFGYIANSPVIKSLVLNGSRFIRLEEITKLSASKFHLGEEGVPEVFNNAIWPAQGNISQTFGWQEDPVARVREFNPSVEFTTDQHAVVMAIADGEIVATKSNQTGSGEIVIDHGNGWNSIYRSITNISVTTGQTVKAGSAIAQTLSNKVTLELRHNQQAVDPFTVIRN